jgi:hypothetical protein
MTACAPPLNAPHPVASGLITPHAPFRSRRSRGETPVPTPTPTPVPTPAAKAIRVRRSPR